MTEGVVKQPVTEQTDSTEQALVPKQKDRIRELLLARRDEMLSLAPTEQVDRMVRQVRGLAAADANLYRCTLSSLFDCATRLLQIGLEPLPGAGEAYLVPYHNKKTGHTVCTLLIGYRGWRKIAGAMGYRLICDVVYDCDAFTFSKLPLAVTHAPDVRRTADAQFIGTYAVAFDRNGETVNAVWVPASDIDKARRLSRSPAWETWPDEMRKKLAISRLAKELQPSPAAPASAAVRHHEAVAADSYIDAEIDETEQTGDATSEALQPGTHFGFGGDK